MFTAIFPFYFFNTYSVFVMHHCTILPESHCVYAYVCMFSHACTCARAYSEVYRRAYNEI